MKINVEKTKTITVSLDNKTHTIIIDEKTVKRVDHFKYLEPIIERSGKFEKEINDKTGKTGRI